MDYGEDESLHFGAEYYPERDDCQTEFHLICARQKSAENDRPVKKLLAEARFTAERIRQLLDEGYPVTDGDGALRPCRPEDIVILMRSPGTRAQAFAGALAERDIPCSFQESGDFFHTMEISVMVALLEIVDNPRQDVPLISVLRSPIFGFTADRLAQVRTAAPAETTTTRSAPTAGRTAGPSWTPWRICVWRAGTWASTPDLVHLRPAQRAGGLRGHGQRRGAAGEPDRPEPACGKIRERRLPGPLRLCHPAAPPAGGGTGPGHKGPGGRVRRAAHEHPQVQGPGVPHRHPGGPGPRLSPGRTSTRRCWCIPLWAWGPGG